jgi:hypothetical protein
MIYTDLVRLLIARRIAVISQFTASFFFNLKDELIFLPQVVAVLNRICRAILL